MTYELHAHLQIGRPRHRASYLPIHSAKVQGVGRKMLLCQPPAPRASVWRGCEYSCKGQASTWGGWRDVCSETGVTVGDVADVCERIRVDGGCVRCGQRAVVVRFEVTGKARLVSG